MKERNNHHDMPYERYFRDGVETLSNQDLIAIILRSCSKDHPVMEVAGNILHLRSPNNNRLCSR